MHDIYHFEDFLRFPKMAFGFALYQPFSRTKGNHNSRFHSFKRIYFIVAVINTLYTIFGLFVYLLKLLNQRDLYADPLELLNDIVQTGSIWAFNAIICNDMRLFPHYGDRIAKLMEDLEEMFPSVQQQSEQIKEKQTEGVLNSLQGRCKATLGFYAVHHYARKSNRFMKKAALLYLIAFTFYNLPPVLEAAKKLFLPGARFSWRTQTNVWYPWHTQGTSTSLALYLVTYFSQMQASQIGLCFLMGGQFLLCFFTTQMQMHFDFLADAVGKLDASGEEAEKKLKYLIDYHSKLLSFSAQINNIFGISFLINFLISSLAICMMSCSIVMATNPVYRLRYSVGLSTMLSSPFFICYCGNEFTRASDQLMLAAFHSNWYAGSRSYRKMILLFMMRSMEPSVLRAYKFADVSMETYAAMLKFSYQLFTFFRTMA